MYYILSGELPFDSLFMEKIVEKTIECEFEMEGRRWRGVSEEGKDLVRRLLCGQRERITVHQALKHPWLKEKEELKSATKRGRGPKYI